MSQIKIELVSKADEPAKQIEALTRKVDELSKSSQAMAREASKGANQTKGSFAALEAELKQNEKALKRLKVGSAEFTEQKKRVDALRMSVANARGEMASTAGRTSGMFDSGISKLTQLAAGMVSFQAVVSAVVNELETVRQLRLDAAQTTRTFEQALADIALNVGAEALPQTRNTIIQEAQNLGVDQAGLANVIGVAISAGANDLKEAVKVSSAALKLTAGDTQKAVALVGGALDVASLAQSKNYEGALGQISQIQSQVRSTDAAIFAANIGPGLAAATAQGQNMQGVSTERAFEIAATISQIIKDPTGSNTATTVRQFFTRLDSFAPELEKKLDDGSSAKVSQEQINRFSNARTFDERLQMMRGDRDLMLQFLETQRESIGKTAVREIISGSDRAVEFERKAAAAITSIDGASENFTQLAKAIQAETIVLSADRQVQASIQAKQVQGGLEGQVQKTVEDTLNSVNLSGLDKDTRFKLDSTFEANVAAGNSITETAIAVLEEAKEQRKLFGVVPIGGQVSQTDVEQINRAIETIGRLAAAIEQQQKAQKPDRQIAVAGAQMRQGEGNP